MNYFLSLKHKKNKTSLALYLIGFCLLFTNSASAIDLQCNLADNSQINPEVIATMAEAADKGYLYLIDTNTSNIRFQVNHFPFSRVEGHFSDFQGGMTLPTDTVHSRQALFLIKVDSITTGDKDIDDYVKSSVFFDATHYPDIIFISTGFEWVNKSTARLYGDLTLKGMTKAIVFTAHIDNTDSHNIKNEPKMVMIASAEIQRSEFGMHEMQVLVSDTVRFDLQIEASRIGI